MDTGVPEHGKQNPQAPYAVYGWLICVYCSYGLRPAMYVVYCVLMAYGIMVYAGAGRSGIYKWLACMYCGI